MKFNEIKNQLEKGLWDIYCLIEDSIDSDEMELVSINKKLKSNKIDKYYLRNYFEKPGTASGFNKVSVIYDSRKLELIFGYGSLFPLNNTDGKTIKFDN
jgi:hypothetical protein